MRNFQHKSFLAILLLLSPAFIISAMLTNETKASKMIRIPLTPKASNISVQQRYAHRLSSTPKAQRRNSQRVLNKLLRQATNDTLMLKNFNNLQYAGMCYVGSELFTVIFDTGAPWSWLAAPVCDGCEHYGISHFYSCGDSNTCLASGQNVTIRYGRGTVSGELYQDTISFAPLEAYRGVHNASFVVVDSIRNFAALNADGFIGLSHGGNPQNNNEPSLLTKMVEQGLISDSVFSLFLGSKESGAQSELIIGGYDENLADGVFEEHALTSEMFWQVDLSGGFWVDAIRLENSPPNVILDSGTNVIVFDPMTGTDVNEAMEANGILCEVRGDAEMRLFCRNSDATLTKDYFPTLSFQIDNKPYTLEGKYYAGRCNVALRATPSQIGCLTDLVLLPVDPILILGQPFLRKYYTVYYEEQAKIGIAVAKSGKQVLQAGAGEPLPTIPIAIILAALMVMLIGFFGLISLRRNRIKPVALQLNGEVINMGVPHLRLGESDA